MPEGVPTTAMMSRGGHYRRREDRPLGAVPAGVDGVADDHQVDVRVPKSPGSTRHPLGENHPAAGRVVDGWWSRQYISIVVEVYRTSGQKLTGMERSLAGSATQTPRLDTNRLAAALKILADTNRLRILDTLLAGTQCNCDLGDRLNMAPNLISHHLGILKRSGLVHAEKDAEDARWIHYSVDRQALDELKMSLCGFLDAERPPRPAGCPR